MIFFGIIGIGSCRLIIQATAEAKIKELSSGKQEIQNLGEFLSSLGGVQVSFPDSGLYKAFLGLGNQYLIRDPEKLKVLGRFYSFEELAMTNFKIFSDHFVDDYKRTLTDYYKGLKAGKENREDLVSILVAYTHHIKHALKSYEKHEEDRKAVVKSLGPSNR